MKKILIIHGPNLNLLGKREPEIYGSTTLAEIDDRLREVGVQQSIEINTFQSNHEGLIIDKIQAARHHYQGMLINPGGYTHTSVAIRDAIQAINIPVIEVHISNIYARERFRQQSLIAGVCAGSVSGFGINSYKIALLGLILLLGSEIKL